MSALIDLTGKHFDRLEVLGFAGTKVHNGRSNSLWLCRCDCKNVVTVLGLNLRNGNTKSCGCMRRETSSQRAKILNEKRWASNVHKSTAAAATGT